MKRIKLDPAETTLILANCVPFVGVALFGWDVPAVLFAYWAENAVIGIFMVVKMVVILAQPARMDAESAGSSARWPVLDAPSVRKKIPRFLLTLLKLISGASWIARYSIPFAVFMAGHLLFLVVMAMGWTGDSDKAIATLIEYAPTTLLSCSMLAVRHGVAFSQYFMGRKEYLRADIDELGIRSMKRIGVMQIVIIFGGFLVIVLDLPELMIGLFIVLKTGLDLTNQRKSIAQLPPAPTAPALSASPILTVRPGKRRKWRA